MRRVFGDPPTLATAHILVEERSVEPLRVDRVYPELVQTKAQRRDTSGIDRLT